MEKELESFRKIMIRTYFHCAPARSLLIAHSKAVSEMNDLRTWLKYL